MVFNRYTSQYVLLPSVNNYTIVNYILIPTLYSKIISDQFF